MKIVKVEKIRLHNFRDCTDEWESQINIDLILDKKFEFEFLENKIFIDRIKVHNMGECYWSDNVHPSFANESKIYFDLTVPFSMYATIYKILIKEEKSGILKGWCISDDLKEEYKCAKEKKTKNK